MRARACRDWYKRKTSLQYLTPIKPARIGHARASQGYTETARDGQPVEFNRFIAYGSGDAGIMTFYGIGRTEKEALEDSIQYGYDPDGVELALGTVELSDRAYKFISDEGCNDMGDDRLYWDIYSNKLMLAEEKA